MAYPGAALIAMVGIGLGFALWYFLADDSPHAQGPHNSNIPPPRAPSPSNNQWNTPKNSSRRRQKSLKRATYDCQICREPMNGAAEETKCSHMFHSKCIEQWRTVSIEQSVTPCCPLCRHPI